MLAKETTGFAYLRGIVRQEKSGSTRTCYLLTFLLLSDYVIFANGFALPAALEEDTRGVVGETNPSGGPEHHHHHHHHQMKSMKMPERVDEDGELVAAGVEESSNPAEISLPRMQSVRMLLQKYKEDVTEQEEQGNDREDTQRMLWSKDFERRASELCGTSASLACGKRILALIDGQEGDLNVHTKCNLRDDFLECIGAEKKGCLHQAKSSALPELPPKEIIKAEQSKLWKILWTAGGCVLANY